MRLKNKYYLIHAHSFFDKKFLESRAIPTNNKKLLRENIALYISERKSFSNDTALSHKFGQFISCSVILDQIYTEPDLTEIGNWLNWAISDSAEVSYIHQFDLTTFYNFIDSDIIASWNGYTPTMVMYFSLLYYYARESSNKKYSGGAFPYSHRIIQV